MRVTVYVEGGGRAVLRRACQQAFLSLFEKAGLRRSRMRVVACQSRGDAIKTFRTALQCANQGEFILLLVDSEGPVHERHRDQPWNFLEAIVGPDRMERPKGAADEQAHLMVQCMESWLLADPAQLASYFKRGFHAGSLPAGNLEQVGKNRVLESLKHATRNCSRGPYDKGKHSFEILAVIDPARVEKVSPHAERLFGLLRAKGAGR